MFQTWEKYRGFQITDNCLTGGDWSLELQFPVHALSTVYVMNLVFEVTNVAIKSHASISDPNYYDSNHIYILLVTQT